MISGEKALLAVLEHFARNDAQAANLTFISKTLICAEFTLSATQVFANEFIFAKAKFFAYIDIWIKSHLDKKCTQSANFFACTHAN